MAGLAEASDANYYYVKDTEKLPEIFAKELGELLTIAARQVQIEVTCPDGVEPLDFIGRTEQFENQKATVKLSHFTAGQNRFLFLRCLVNGTEPEIARVKVTYADELDNGVEQSVARSVRVRFTNDGEVAAKAINVSVVAQKELTLTAVRKDEALADADAGKFGEAARKLDSQAAILESSYSSAPASIQVQIRTESENLRNRSRQLQKGDYDSSTRKTMQSESWTIRNSK
jgi:Ca-activated chloride channel family protein